MDQNASTSTTFSDSGLETPVKRRKLEAKNTEKIIIDTMCGEIAKFGDELASIILIREKTDEDYRRLYRPYVAVLKALSLLDTERADLEDGLKSLPPGVDRLLQSSNDNVKPWSHYFFKNPSPSKIKNVKTIPSPVTGRIGGLLHSIGSFIGLTAEAVCSSKRKKENFENMKYLLKVANFAIPKLEMHRNDIVDTLEPFIQKNRDIQDANPGTSAQNN